MIPKTNKFPMRTDFLRFRARAKRFVTPHATCYLLPATKQSHLSVVVPVKVSKLATTRNYLKRLVYDHLYPQIVDKKLDCVIVFKPLPLTKSPATKQLIISELNAFLASLS